MNLESITTIFTTVGQWFVSMFKSLSAVFYETTSDGGQLTTIGYILFIGVAIMLVMMCLRWVLSLVRGV